MAIRNIINEKEEVLHKKCRPVTAFDDRLGELLDDMKDTLLKADGVGLAAPQVGVLRRLFIMNADGRIIEAINPEIVRREGEQEGVEGCLSCPGAFGVTRRPQKVRLKAQDRHGKWFYFTGEDLMARCVCHENDHLDGVLFREHVIRMLDPSELGD